MQQIENIEKAIDKIDSFMKNLKEENSSLLRENKELLSVIEDRDLEILQLQEDLSRRSNENEGEKTEITNKLQGLLGRMQSMIPDEKKEEEEEKEHTIF
ncbi:MAG: hypothetical protein GXZ13_02960 [Synergistaceae bacterium]|jgi:hypothetical protein|nr:hypothetical protein [Synergistaceae bacterium]